MQRVCVVIAWSCAFCVLNFLTKQYAAKLTTPLSGWRELAGELLVSLSFYLMAFLYGVCAVLYLLALRLMPLSQAGPVFLTAGVLCTVALGTIWFQEAVTPMKLAGVFLCLSGIGLLVA